MQELTSVQFFLVTHAIVFMSVPTINVFSYIFCIPTLLYFSMELCEYLCVS